MLHFVDPITYQNRNLEALLSYLIGPQAITCSKIIHHSFFSWSRVADQYGITFRLLSSQSASGPFKRSKNCHSRIVSSKTYPFIYLNDTQCVWTNGFKQRRPYPALPGKNEKSSKKHETFRRSRGRLNQARSERGAFLARICYFGEKCSRNLSLDEGISF